MISCVICRMVLVACCVWLSQSSTASDREIDMNVTETIRYHGYPCENHQVTTEDGYILSLQRIPFGLNSDSTDPRPVVLLQHGLQDSTFTWVANGPKKSLSFVLADNGFDVWLCNSRGNVYSNSHITNPSNSREFWDFTWNEMAEYDLPAAINYILSVTKAPKLGYVGHSQGTEIAFARFSKDSDLDSKVSAFVALTPVAYLGHLKTVIRYIAHLADGIHLLSKLLTNGEFSPKNEILQQMKTYVCGDQIGSVVCGNLMFLTSGISVSNLNFSRMAIYVSHSPAGTSTKNMVHYAQSYLSNEFQMFDYGFFGNLLRYRQRTPPKYNLNNVKIPVAAFWGGNDWLAVPEDVSRTLNELGDCVKFKKYVPEYNHMDFVWGITADTVIFPDIIDFLRRYNS